MSGTNNLVQSSADKARALRASLAGNQPASENGVTVEGSNSSAPIVDAAHSSHTQQTGQPAAAPAAQPTRPDYVDQDDWKTRYKLLRASGDKRNAKLQADVTRLESENSELRQRLASQTPQSQSNNGLHVDDEAREQLGEAGSKVVDNLVQRINQQDATVAQQQARESERVKSRFETDLDTLVPEWEAINVDPKFLAWLSVADEGVGYTRHQFLNMAVGQSDAEGAARTFRAYINSLSPTQSQNANAQPSVEIEPTRSIDDTSGFVEMWSPQEINEHYEEKNRAIRMNTYVGELKTKIDARQIEIDKARAEGRIG